jgi:hypothetical protein
MGLEMERVYSLRIFDFPEPFDLEFAVQKRRRRMHLHVATRFSFR